MKMGTSFLELLENKVEPSRIALVVIDVQNDFCSMGGFMDREGRDLSAVHEMLPRLAHFVEAARRVDIPIIFTQATYGIAGDWHLSPAWLDRAERVNQAGAYIEYPVCSEGEWGFELYEGFGPRPGSREIRLKKHRYSAFVNTELDLLLRSQGIKTLVIGGVATNVCVESTARDAFMRDYYVVLVEDCCATYTEFEQEGTLHNVRTYFGEVVDSEAVIAAWSSIRSNR
jgi:ureidoacrylate peracid hydrolase